MPPVPLTSPAALYLTLLGPRPGEPDEGRPLPYVQHPAWLIDAAYRGFMAEARALEPQSREDVLDRSARHDALWLSGVDYRSGVASHLRALSERLRCVDPAHREFAERYLLSTLRTRPAPVVPWRVNEVTPRHLARAVREAAIEFRAALERRRATASSGEAPYVVGGAFALLLELEPGRLASDLFATLADADRVRASRVLRERGAAWAGRVLSKDQLLPFLSDPDAAVRNLALQTLGGRGLPYQRARR